MTASSAKIFPIIRLVSQPFTRLLMHSPFSANQISACSLVFGLACNWCMMQGKWEMAVAGGLLLLLCYILDNSDGDVARFKGHCSEFGMRFDSFVDWVVNATFFPALGHGYTIMTGESLWTWLGWAAFAGGTINYLVGFWIEAREKRRLGKDAKSGHQSPEEAKQPEKWHEWVIFIFRELTRADFCFIVLALALFDTTWVLIPVGAIGSHVYWLTQFIRGSNEYHV